MGAKFWSTVHQLDHPWNKVATFYWSRYPNPNSQHVFSEDVIGYKVDEEGKLRTKRIIVKTNKLPWWGRHLFSSRRVALIEEIVVDPVRRTMTTYTRNIGLRLFMGVTEKCTYQAVESDDVTRCDKVVWIESDLVGLRSAIKKFGVDRFKTNSLLATEGLRWAIENQQLNIGTPAKSSSKQGSTSSAIHPSSFQQSRLISGSLTT